MGHPATRVTWLPPLLLTAASCVDTSPKVEEQPERSFPATVTVALDDVIVEVPPYAYGIHASVYDNALHHPELKSQLDEAGIRLVRWPGGGYSDNYHWATHSMTPWSDGNRGYLARDSDFGSFVKLLERIERVAMITVNYGSNQSHDGPGEPKEAAAWVAYANGDPNDDTVIGEDSTGFDWQTVGYWAGLRAMQPLEEDDAFNFLRIGREEPVAIEYWEIGNEVFGNGYYNNGGEDGFELDLHLPYDGTVRQGHPALSGTSYGRGVLAYVEAMKAVDDNIKVGAVLNTPPADYAWGPSWNDEVLGECGDAIDFGIIHWYPNDADLPTAASRTMPTMFEELRESLDANLTAGAESVEIVVTELGPPPGASPGQVTASGLFAADAYLSFIEHGASNVDWLELHNTTFLSEDDASQRGRAFHGIKLAHSLAPPGALLVQSSSSDPAQLISHAAIRSDGSVALLLINTNPHQTAHVAVTLPNDEVSAMASSYAAYASGEPPSEIEGPVNVTVQGGEAQLALPSQTMTLLEVAP